MSIEVYYDYTCAHSYALFDLLRHLDGDGEEITWRTLCLKELRRHPHEPSVFDDKEAGSFSVLALALSHAARDGKFSLFHESLFDAIHREQLELTRDDLRELAASAGVEVAKFDSHTSKWVDRVKAEHTDGADQWSAHGTPTVVFDERTAVYFRFDRSQMKPQEAWQLMNEVARAGFLVEAKRSV